MEGFLCGGPDALANGSFFPTVHVEAQAAELLLHLQHLEGDSSLFFDFGDQWF
jgi:hypothetical protein